MKIVNNTDTEIVITGPNATTFKRIFAGTSAHLDPNFDDAVISCDYGHIDIVMTSEFDGTFRVYPHGDLEAICEVDSESYDFVVKVFRVATSEKQSNNWFVQQDKILHDKAIRDASNHLPNAHITAFKRIDELTNAIQKSIQICVPNETTSDVKLIRNWAKEIMLQCNIIDSIDED